MAENDDEWATVSTVEDDVVDNSSNNNGPSGINDPSLFNKIISLLVNTNPWIIFFIGVALYYVLQNILSFQQQTSSSHSSTTPNSEEILAREEAIEAARRRMQEQYNLKAKEAAIKRKEKEELQRQEKLKNLEKYGTVLGRSSKTLVAEENNTLSASQVLGTKNKKPEKSKLRPEYNPLMGDGGGSSGVCFRPARRSGGAGGG